MKTGPLSFALGLLVSAAEAQAHDLWLEPERLRVPVGWESPVPVRLKVGSGEDVKTIARKPERIIRLEAVGATGARPLAGDPGDDPFARLDVRGLLAGSLVLVYTSHPAYIELEGAEFEAYLEHEGLHAVKEARARRGESEAVGKESYARAAKALVTLGGAPSGFDRVLGLRLELVPLEDPRRPGAPLRFRLLHRGEPLSGARVDLMPTDDLTRATTSTTGPDGQVTFPAPAPGRHLVATTHMERAAPDEKGDWSSIWATFTFEVPPGDPPAGRPSPP